MKGGEVFRGYHQLFTTRHRGREFLELSGSGSLPRIFQDPRGQAHGTELFRSLEPPFVFLRVFDLLSLSNFPDNIHP